MLGRRRRRARLDEPEALPLAVRIGLDDSLRTYWLARADQHTKDWYAGTRIAKFPEDLRVYEHLLWQSKPNAVIELGASAGGSALWFRDRLRTLAAYGRIEKPRVVSIDLDVEPARASIGSMPFTAATPIRRIRGASSGPIGARC